MARWNYFLLIVLPIVWVTVAAVSFQYPGDEYGLWAVGSAAGIWILWLFASLEAGVAPGRILPSVLVAGVATMAVLGFVLDRLRSPRVSLAVTWLVTTVFTVAFMLNQFDTYERAMAKNGSLQAYIFSAANLALLLVSLLFVLMTSIFAVIRRRRGLKGPRS